MNSRLHGFFTPVAVLSKNRGRCSQMHFQSCGALRQASWAFPLSLYGLFLNFLCGLYDFADGINLLTKTFRETRRSRLETLAQRKCSQLTQLEIGS